MKIHTIQTPIWKTSSVGIAHNAIGIGDNGVRIEYRNKIGRNKGELMFPGLHCMDGDAMKEYPIQVWRSVKLHIIPISRFEVKVDELQE